MIDKKALYAIQQGVYVFTTLDGERPVGRIVDAVSQVAAEPKRVSVALMKEGFTSRVIRVSRRFALTVLATDAPMAVIESFGYRTSEDADKFAGFDVRTDGEGVAYVADGAVARMSCEVAKVLDMGSHLLVIGDVTEAEVYSQAEPMTYAGFRAAKAAAKVKQEAPAQTGKTQWRCTICGHIVEADELPEDFVCPVCGVPRDLFERV